MEGSNKKGFLDRISSFSVVLITVVFMVIGAALVPFLKIAYNPSPKQNNKLTISYTWKGASARVVEQEVTSKIEGLVSSVSGVGEISSTSSEGAGQVNIALKENANLTTTRFEISSLLRQIAKKLPEGVDPPSISGGNATGGELATKQVLSYVINADLGEAAIFEYIERNVKPFISQIEQVREINISGVSPMYLDIEYDPFVLRNYGLNSSSIYSGVKNFLGRNLIVGDVDRETQRGDKERITLLLSTSELGNDLSKTPLTMVNGKMVYLGDIATVDYKERAANSYYRINGLNTIYLNISIDSDANIIALSDQIQETIKEIKPNLKEGFFITLTQDEAKEIKKELNKLVRRTLLSLLILFIFVWISSRSGRYLSIIAITLFANILISVIIYFLLGIELHLFSLAGITVSFGIIIDSSIVMVNHYNYYRNRHAFTGILAAMLTTIGSLAIIFFMPDYVKNNLYDFALIVIINLVIALYIALFFVPALINQYGLKKDDTISSIRHRRRMIGWSRFYAKYILFTQRHKWIYIIIFVLAFGIPVHLLPTKLGEVNYWEKVDEDVEPKWYVEPYNKTIGSTFYQQTLKEPLEKILGGSFRLFSKTLEGGRTFSWREEELKLYISAKLTEGEDASLLNQKMRQMDNFLSEFDEIEQFTTIVGKIKGNIIVKFKEESRLSAFPSYLENQVISEALKIGGVDWSTSGVSERGFSNSLNLDRKSHRIGISGYNYDRLYSYAEMVAEKIKSNQRVSDVEVEESGSIFSSYSRQNTQQGLYIKYDKEKIALYNIDLARGYSALSEILKEGNIGKYTKDEENIDIDYHSLQRDKFDAWHLFNSYLTVESPAVPASSTDEKSSEYADTDQQIRYSHISEIGKRDANRSISKENQEYSLEVAFNFLGSYTLSDKFIERTTKEVNSMLPVGFQTKNRSYGWYRDTGKQYWLILVIVIIIFFICSILFESLRQPIVIISLIPISFIGTFLTFHFCDVNFGHGGFASLVLLSGLVVNSAIYIINEYNNCKRTALKRTDGTLNQARLYIKSYNHKIIPVFLTIVSTILGLIPFLMDGKEDEFWFAFAIGTTSGLLFSVIALIFIMPIIMPLRQKAKKV